MPLNRSADFKQTSCKHRSDSFRSYYQVNNQIESRFFNFESSLGTLRSQVFCLTHKGSFLQRLHRNLTFQELQCENNETEQAMIKIFRTSLVLFHKRPSISIQQLVQIHSNVSLNGYLGK